jgi:hypothetical protein
MPYESSAGAIADACLWAIAQASRHPTAPRTGRALSRNALVRGVTRLPSVPDRKRTLTVTIVHVGRL